MYESENLWTPSTPVILAAVGVALTAWRPRAAAAYWSVLGVGLTAVAVHQWGRRNLRDFEARARFAGQLQGMAMEGATRNGA